MDSQKQQGGKKMNQKILNGEFDRLAATLRDIGPARISQRIGEVKEFAKKNGMTIAGIAEKLAPGRVGSWRYYPKLEEFRVQISCRKGKYGYADCVTLIEESNA
jgi:hypothetical protein